MSRLQILCQKDSNQSGRTDIIIVPGNAGNSLEDQTCSHFPAWLNEIVDKRDRCMTVWIFHHDILIERLESWSAYCEAGEQLLQDLNGVFWGRSGEEASV